MKIFVLPAALLAALSLAACDNTPEAETPPAPTVVETPVATPAPAPATSTAPPADGSAVLEQMETMMPEGTMAAMQEQIANMTPEQREEAIVQARTTAETMAREQGLSDEMVTQVGDQAEAAARQMFEAE